jgi:hypothetical protein
VPAVSAEALARKKQRKRERERKASPTRAQLALSDLPQHKITRRRMMKHLPPMTKAELREMLAKAFQNTAKQEIV